MRALRAARHALQVPPVPRDFRADIEGMRAIAVIGVMLWHAGVPLLPGGFVGVDVFFVVSGFLMTALLLEACGADWDQVQPVADRKGHDRRYSLDITKISEELGYQPSYDLTRGLAETVAWYRENRAWWEPLRTKAAIG